MLRVDGDEVLEDTLEELSRTSEYQPRETVSAFVRSVIKRLNNKAIFRVWIFAVPFALERVPRSY